MIVYVAESRTADGLAEPVSIAPIVSELSVNQTPSEINAVPICTVVQNCMLNGMSNRMVNRMTHDASHEINAVPICTVVRPRTVSWCKTRRRGPRPVCPTLAIPLIASELC